VELQLTCNQVQRNVTLTASLARNSGSLDLHKLFEGLAKLPSTATLLLLPAGPYAKITVLDVKDVPIDNSDSTCTAAKVEIETDDGLWTAWALPAGLTTPAQPPLDQSLPYKLSYAQAFDAQEALKAVEMEIEFSWNDKVRNHKFLVAPGAKGDELLLWHLFPNMPMKDAHTMIVLVRKLLPRRHTSHVRIFREKKEITTAI